LYRSKVVKIIDTMVQQAVRKDWIMFTQSNRCSVGLSKNKIREGPGLGNEIG
jgi:hypothetical protein